MKRGKDQKKLGAMLTEVRLKVRHAVLRSTVIVGFPGEDDADFDKLMAFATEVRFERLGVFKYSDEEGTAANIGANIMAGRRGQMGMGSAGTQITGSLERPFLGGRLGLDVSVDPSLRQREILLGYRRAF